MKKKNKKDAPWKNEHFIIGDENSKRIPKIWQTKLANLSPEAKKRMADRMKKFNKRFKIK